MSLCYMTSMMPLKPLATSPSPSKSISITSASNTAGHKNLIKPANKLTFSIDAIVGHNERTQSSVNSDSNSNENNDDHNHCNSNSISVSQSNRTSNLKSVSPAKSLTPSSERVANSPQTPIPLNRASSSPGQHQHFQTNTFASLHHPIPNHQFHSLQQQSSNMALSAALSYQQQQQAHHHQHHAQFVPPEYHQAMALYPWLMRAGPPMGFPPRFHVGPFDGQFPSFLLPAFRKPKRIRTAFSPGQLLKLEHAFEKNHYVVGNERKTLASNLGLSETQVKVWFQNRRTKHKRQKQEEDEGQCNSGGNKDGHEDDHEEDDEEDHDDESIDLNDDDEREEEEREKQEQAYLESLRHHAWQSSSTSLPISSSNSKSSKSSSSPSSANNKHNHTSSASTKSSSISPQQQ